jgi:cytochrome c peroxidase
MAREEPDVLPRGAPIRIKVPLGLPPLAIPEDNRPTLDTVALGRRLFYDPKVSADHSLSCASCHNPGLGFTDGRAVSIGTANRVGRRNAPTVLNAAYLSSQFWDGRAKTLEEQAAAPISNPVEMNHPHTVFLTELNADPGYLATFERAFGPGPITMSKVEKCLASFERTMLSGDSPFDRYEYGGDKNALSAAAIRGLSVFRDPQKGNCGTCHTIGDQYALFSDGKFHNLGVGMNAEGELTDLGRYEQTRVEADKGAFRTPTLRNVARTGPYMHDGSEKTLNQVIDFYVGGCNSNPQLDPQIKPLHLTTQEKDDLVEFLKSLTGVPPAAAGPVQ